MGGGVDEIAPTLLRRVGIRNYKSIAACSVSLERLSFLVGPNGSGKSNFLDALRFVAESLRTSVDHALRDRGGINEVRRRSSGHPTNFGIRLDYSLWRGVSGHYAFTISARERGGFTISREECRITSRAGTFHFSVKAGVVGQSSLQTPPPALKDRLYLVAASGHPSFRPVFDALSSMGFYNLNPGQIKELQPPDPGDLLLRDGGNLASVFDRIRRDHPGVQVRIQEYLSKVVPVVTGVDHDTVGHKETLFFRQAVRGAKHPWRFPATNMSDGTLRALGVLVALFQPLDGSVPRLVGIEEPETALHPAAAGIITEALRDAANVKQILVTSHSPDLLDNRSIPTDQILAVVSEDGETRIGRLDETGRKALQEDLYTAGELLRLDQLRPDLVDARISPDQLGLFGEG